MPSFETLDAIADAYNPIVGILCLTWIAVQAILRHWRLAAAGIIQFVLVASVAYGWMALDNASGGRIAQWIGIGGIDYSTHTAVAFCGAWFLGSNLRPARLILAVSTSAYFLLMLYQRYHTVADMVFTLILVAPLAIWLVYLARKVANERKPAPGEVIHQ